MSSSETSYANLAQQANQIGPFREAILGVLGFVGFGNTRANIGAILDQEPSQVVQTCLENNEKINGVLGNVGSIHPSANDSIGFQKAA